jgi:peptide/nickel transport system permease protein
MTAPTTSDVTTAAATSRSLTRARRKAARRRFYRAFAQQRSGLVGLGILTIFVLLAVFAPVLFSSDGLDVTKATGGVLQPPSAEFPLGTDESGRSVLALLVWGARISLVVGVAATIISIVLGALVGIASGHYTACSARSWNGHRLVPGILLPSWRSSSRRVARQSIFNIILVIGVTSWPATSRLERPRCCPSKDGPT